MIVSGPDDQGAVVLKSLADVLESFYTHDLLTILRHENEHCHFGLTIKYVLFTFNVILLC
jgi:hypothetical protein